MQKKIFEKHPSFPFSKAIQLNPFVFLSGMVAPKSDNIQSISEEIEQQASWLMNAVERQLITTSSTLHNILFLRVFLRDLNYIGEVKQIFYEFFNHELPACTFIQASALPSPSALIEIDVVAAMNEPGQSEDIA